MAEKFTDLDLATLLKSREARRVFLASAFETGDPKHIAEAIGIAARSHGMAKIADATGLAREQLYMSLSAKGNPTLETMMSVMKALDVTVTTKAPKRSRSKAKDRTKEAA